MLFLFYYTAYPNSRLNSVERATDGNLAIAVIKYVMNIVQILEFVLL